MKELIAMPTSKFIQVICPKCKSEQIVFSKAATLVKCESCGNELVEPCGGTAFVKGKVLRSLG